MKTLVLTLLLAAPGWGLLTYVRDHNRAVATGRAAYARGQDTEASVAFGAAVAAMGKRVQASLLLNLAHAQLRAGQVPEARRTYGRLLAGGPPAIASVARQQLGVLAAREGQTAQALALLKQALLLDPRNSAARYNYETLSQYLNQQQGPKLVPPPPKTKPQPEK